MTGVVVKGSGRGLARTVGGLGVLFRPGRRRGMRLEGAKAEALANSSRARPRSLPLYSSPVCPTPDPHFFRFFTGPSRHLASPRLYCEAELGLACSGLCPEDCVSRPAHNEFQTFEPKLSTLVSPNLLTFILNTVVFSPDSGLGAELSVAEI